MYVTLNMDTFRQSEREKVNATCFQTTLMGFFTSLVYFIALSMPPAPTTFYYCKKTASIFFYSSYTYALKNVEIIFRDSSY